MIFIAIDPGPSSGGAAAIKIHQEDGVVSSALISTIKFKDVTKHELSKWFDDLGQASDNMKALLELVHAFPRQGVSSMFKFGRNTGLLEGLLVSKEIPYIEVSPQKWMKHFNMKKTKIETKLNYKKRLRQLAQERYPDTQIVSETADAVLMAEYLKELHVLKWKEQTTALL